MILVTGATGTVGTEILTLLERRGAPARALVRDPARLRAARWRGLDVVTADLADGDAVRRAMDGVTQVFLLTKPSPGQAALDRTVIAAAVAARVAGLVKLSALGAGAAAASAMNRCHWEGERLVAGAGLPFTVLRPNFFMQNLLAMARRVAKTGELALPSGDTPIAMVDVCDVAEVAVGRLLDGRHEGAVHPLTGPEALTLAEVAARVTEAASRPVRARAVDPGDFRAQLERSGIPAWSAEALTDLYRDMAVDGSRPASDLAALLGRRPRDVRSFVLEHAARFRPAEPAPAV